MKSFAKNYSYLSFVILGALTSLGFVVTFSASCKKETDNIESYDSYRQTFNRELERVFNADSGFRWNNNNIELLVEPIDDYDPHKIINEARNKILEILRHSAFIIVDPFYPNDIHIPTPPLFTPHKLKLGLSKNGKFITKTVTFNIIVENTLFDIRNEIKKFINLDEFLLLIRANFAFEFIKNRIYEFLETILHVNKSYLKEKVDIKLAKLPHWEWWRGRMKIVCDFTTKTGEKISRHICRYLN